LRGCLWFRGVFRGEGLGPFFFLSLRGISSSSSYPLLSAEFFSSSSNRCPTDFLLLSPWGTFFSPSFTSREIIRTPFFPPSEVALNAQRFFPFRSTPFFFSFHVWEGLFPSFFLASHRETATLPLPCFSPPRNSSPFFVGLPQCKFEPLQNFSLSVTMNLSPQKFFSFGFFWSSTSASLALSLRSSEKEMKSSSPPVTPVSGFSVSKNGLQEKNTPPRFPPFLSQFGKVSLRPGRPL